MKIKETLKKHSSKIQKTVVVTLAVGTAVTLVYMTKTLMDRTLMLEASIAVIEELGGDAPKLIVEHLMADIAKDVI